MGMRAQSAILYVVAVAAVIAAGYGVGKLTAVYYNGHANRQYLAARSYSTNELLAQMNTIKVGDILPNHLFRRLGGDTAHLSRLLQSRTILIFVDLGCTPCLDQIEMLGRVTTTPQERCHFLVVSRADPGQLSRLRSDLSVQCEMLLDSAGTFHEKLSIHSSPFSIVVDSGRVIRSIVAGSLLEEEMLELAHAD